jgi:ribulose-phosphate 3-epimerase
MGGIGVSASAWSADLTALGTQLTAAEPFCDSFHFDVMDGHYVPNLLFGPDQLRALRQQLSVPFEGHFMTWHADAVCPLFYDVCETFILHYDACSEWPKLLRELRARDKRVGLAIRVEEDWRNYIRDLPQLDLVVMMGTELGIKGVDIDARVFDSLRALRYHVDTHGLPLVIQADGGIRRDTVADLISAGAHAITPGSLFFNSDHTGFRHWLDQLGGTRMEPGGSNANR